MIKIKTPREIDLMQISGRIVAQALALAERLVRVGAKTSELDHAIEAFILEQGAVPSFKNYNGFPASCCISVNDQVVHGIPGSYRLQDGDIVSVDIGAYKNGFHGDAARTFCVGNVSQENRKLVEITEACFWQGMEYACAGNRLGDVSHAIEQLAHEHGYGVVEELVGHGIGEQMHEQPDVPNYGKAGRGPRLEEGMALAIEPMINRGTKKIEMLDDGWTIVAQDGAPSAHYENTIVITQGAPLILTVLELHR